MKTGTKKPCIGRAFLLGTDGLVNSFDPIGEKDLSPNHGSLWDGYGFAVAFIIAGNVDDHPRRSSALFAGRFPC